jgi:hypothetical protein
MEMGEWHTAAPVKLRDVPRTCIAIILVLVGFDGFSHASAICSLRQPLSDEFFV